MVHIRLVAPLDTCHLILEARHSIRMSAWIVRFM